MQQINYHTNTIIEPITTLTHKEARIIRATAYKRGLRAGIIITTIILTTLFTTYAIHANNRLMDEVHATNYYYNLSNNK